MSACWVIYVREKMFTLPEHLISTCNGGFTLFLYHFSDFASFQMKYSVGQQIWALFCYGVGWFYCSQMCRDEATILSYLGLIFFYLLKIGNVEILINIFTYIDFDNLTLSTFNPTHQIALKRENWFWHNFIVNRCNPMYPGDKLFHILSTWL